MATIFKNKKYEETVSDFVIKKNDNLYFFKMSDQ